MPSKRARPPVQRPAKKPAGKRQALELERENARTRGDNVPVTAADVETAKQVTIELAGRPTVAPSVIRAVMREKLHYLLPIIEQRVFAGHIDIEWYAEFLAKHAIPEKITHGEQIHKHAVVLLPPRALPGAA
jgi:hypothetical protein